MNPEEQIIEQIHLANDEQKGEDDERGEDPFDDPPCASPLVGELPGDIAL